MDRRWIGGALLAALGACEARSGRRLAKATASPSASAPAATARPAPPPSASARSQASAEPAAPTASAPSGDAGAAPVAKPAAPGKPGDPCRLTRGPIQLTFTGPATILPEGDADPRVVFNQDGVPRPVVLPAAAKAAPPPGKASKAGAAKEAKPERLALAGAAERAASPACAAAGDALFCLDKAGGVHRWTRSGEGGAVVAQARPGSPLTAASLAGGHVAYAFLGDRRTTEGAVTLAFVGLDDAMPTTLSEDGSGATYVLLASRAEDAVAVYVDARRVLTPVHARVLSAPSGKLVLGQDAVVFVGGGTDGRTPGAIARGKDGHELALLPIEKDEKAFGLAAIRVEEQPRDDAAVTWSLYPAAMERPAVAATQGVWPIRVLHARPAGADTKGKKVLELGELDAAGTFKPLCPVADGSSYADLSVAVDGAGALWLAYTDGEGTWIEKRGP